MSKLAERKTDSLFLSLLTVAFIVLKLCHVINWSWWWVLSPIWIPILVVLAIGIIVFVGWVVIRIFKK